MTTKELKDLLTALYCAKAEHHLAPDAPPDKDILDLYDRGIEVVNRELGDLSGVIERLEEIEKVEEAVDRDLFDLPIKWEEAS